MYSNQSKKDDKSPTHNPTPSTSHSRRPRAPTITIDTSAVSSSPPDTPSHLVSSPEGLQAPAQFKPRDGNDSLRPALQVTTTDLKPRASIESHASRPVSPHNVSSPVSRWQGDGEFLKVPAARSRGNSFDSDSDHSHSPRTSYTGETATNNGDGSSDGPTRKGSMYTVSTARSDAPLLKNGKDNDDTELDIKPVDLEEAQEPVENNPFAYTPHMLNKLMDPKSLGAFMALGGIAGLEKGLRTSLSSGLSSDESKLDGQVTLEQCRELTREITRTKTPPENNTDSTQQPQSNGKANHDDRIRVFSDNRLPERKPKTIWQLAWIAFKDKVLIILTIAAIVSLALGIYQSTQPHMDGEAPVEWVEGVAIIVAILIVVGVGAVNDWQKEKQFVKLNKRKEDRLIKVIRDGREQEISVHDVLVGDLVCVSGGDKLPVDGIFVKGHGLVCDESSETGESALAKKVPAEEVLKSIEKHVGKAEKLDPFMISGCIVADGIGVYVATATGVNSRHGMTMISLAEEQQSTPLQVKLNHIAEIIAKAGLIAGGLLFVVTFIEFLVRLKYIEGGASAKGQVFLNLFIVAITVIVVAVPEGLPLAVTLALAFATTRMLKDNNLVRLLRSCETMGNATAICSDKTGTLTKNKMSVVRGVFTSTTDSDTDSGPKKNDADEDANENHISFSQQTKAMDQKVRDILCQAAVFNTTAFESEDNETAFTGSSTEVAILEWAKHDLGMTSLREERAARKVVQVKPFSSERKCMGTVIETKEGNYRLHVKGASEIMLQKCTKMLSDPLSGLETTPLNQKSRDAFIKVIDDMADGALRTIGILYRDFESWPPKGARQDPDDADAVEFDDIFKEMTLMGIVGLQDPLRDGASEAVKECQKAGVFVRMVTGDNLLTAKAIASECGIFTEGGVVMEGPTFRKLPKREMMKIIPKLQVLARSSPEDKRILVKRLVELGEIVAVTGDGSNDAPALKAADVGFAMGISGTEVAKEAAAIILMDDNFASIVKAMMWGRAVNDAVKKFLQFQVTVNITAVVLTFVTAVANSDQQSVLTAVQLLWVNLIMDTFAALALATDPPTRKILDRKPEPRSAPLITVTMWKMIIGQAIYQLAVTLVLYFAGNAITGYPGPSAGGNSTATTPLQSVIFNSFVWMQIFNQYNCRRLDNKFNIFEGFFANKYFIAIQAIMIGLQVLIVFKGGAAISVVPLDGAQWGVSLIIGLVSVPVAMLIRCIPDPWVEKLIPEFVTRKSQPAFALHDEENQLAFPAPLFEIQDELRFIKLVRGGRAKGLMNKLKNPAELFGFRPRSRSNSLSRSSSFGPSTPENELSELGPDGTHTPRAHSRRPSTVPDSNSTTPQSHAHGHSQRRSRSRTPSTSAFSALAAMPGIVAGSIAGWSPIDGRQGNDPFGNVTERLKLDGRKDLDNLSGAEVHPDTKKEDNVVLKTEEVKETMSQDVDTNPVLKLEQEEEDAKD